MVLRPVESDRWLRFYIPQLQALGEALEVCEVELLLKAGVEWRAIAELRGELPLREGTASAVSFIVDAFARGAVR